MSESRSASRGSRLQRLGLRWLYVLVGLPVLTDMIEAGGLPNAPREWLTEVVVGFVLAGLVRQVRKEHLSALALARSDGLTGLWNQRAFAEAIEDECARVRRTREPLSLVYVDVDNFKRVNDHDGHTRGDEILRQLAAAITKVARDRIDRGFRIGGDEFALLLPGSTAAQSVAVVQRIRAQCERTDPAWVGGPLGMSVGIVEFDAQESSEQFVRRADAAMYQHKARRQS
jgi:diguanylate cyclase (GGDEF)-like protein